MEHRLTLGGEINVGRLGERSKGIGSIKGSSADAAAKENLRCIVEIEGVGSASKRSKL